VQTDRSFRAPDATPAVQRWRTRRASYRPAGEPIATHRFEVAPIDEDNPAKRFVVAHHYSASYPAARRRFGLYRGDELVGVAVFSVPASSTVLAGLPGDDQERAELGRFVLLDHVPANGETWFLGRAFELLRREGFASVVSFSDPHPRTTTTGRVVMPGHVGTIYQAHNAIYLGRARRDTLRLLPDGRTIHSRALAKIRARDRGWRYSATIFESLGARPLRASEDASAWVDRCVAKYTRSIRHPGNHRYGWVLDRRVACLVPSGLAYPKLARAA
jgi:hypothetical protein